MPKLQPTTTINVDEAVYAVEKMPENIKALVAMYDDWRQELADAEQKVVLYRVGLARLQQDLAAAIQEEKEKAAAATEAFTEVTPPAAE